MKTKNFVGEFYQKWLFHMTCSPRGEYAGAASGLPSGDEERGIHVCRQHGIQLYIVWPKMLDKLVVSACISDSSIPALPFAPFEL